MNVVYFDQQTHAQKDSKISKKVLFSSCVREAYEQKRGTNFVGQRLGVTPKSRLLIWIFVVFIFFQKCLDQSDPL